MKERFVICNDEDKDGRARVTADEEQFKSLKTNVSLSQISWKAVSQLRTSSFKTPVSIVAVGSSDNKRP